ncbi:unnamed protein product [Mycena citricolor]|uniref:Uncharacterized protein n=1 Tax=Mycena citricolor TaxID=2018698 RepID=A0AAD2JVF7_9AGAR|nr:unnamed protein product [Mycena citricolor]
MTDSAWVSSLCVGAKSFMGWSAGMWWAHFLTRSGETQIYTGAIAEIAGSHRCRKISTRSHRTKHHIEVRVGKGYLAGQCRP